MTDILIPRFIYRSRRVLVQAGINDTVRWRDKASGTTFSATIPAGLWTAERLGAKAKDVMEPVANSIYNLAYAPEKAHFLVESDGSGGDGTFEIEDGSPSTNNAWSTHFGITGDKTGALIYEGDVLKPDVVTVTMTARIRNPVIIRDSPKGMHEAESGARTTAHLSSVSSFRFRIEFEDPTVAQAIYKMERDSLLFGDRIEFNVDSLIANSRMFGTIDPRSVRVTELTARGLYRKYEMTFDFVRRVPRNADLTTAVGFVDLIDRGPS